MVTTTTPSAAMRAPSYMTSLPVPPVSEPPWIHTNTGAFSAFSGVQTFSDRQSSLMRGVSAGA